MLRQARNLFILALLAACNSDRHSKPVEVLSCGTVTTYEAPPRRAITLNQHASEVLLALGLEQHMVGTAGHEDGVLEEFQAAYARIPVIASGYPTPEQFVEAEPDFVYATFASAFSGDPAKAAAAFEPHGIHVYLSPSSCPAEAWRERYEASLLFRELRDISAIFGVAARGEERIRTIKGELESARAEGESRGGTPTIFWYDGHLDPPLVAGRSGPPQLIMETAGARNIFADKAGSWVEASWEQVVARDPDWIVLVDRPGFTAAMKRQVLESRAELKELRAMQSGRMISIPFSETTPGIRIGKGALRLVRALSDS